MSYRPTKEGAYLWAAPFGMTCLQDDKVKATTHFIAYADGKNDLISISNRINVPTDELYDIIINLENNDLISKIA